MKLIGVDPGGTTGIALIDFSPDTLQVKVLELHEVPDAEMLQVLEQISNRYTVNYVIHENCVHFTTARNQHTTGTSIGCGKVIGWAFAKGLKNYHIPPGSYKMCERRWGNELASYRSHSGAALKHALFFIYHSLKYHKLKIT